MAELVRNVNDGGSLNLRDALAAFDAAMTTIGGCSNHDCMVRPPTGMGTNGPCKCLDDKHTARRFGTAVRRLRKALDAQ